MGVREEDKGLINKYIDANIPFIYLNKNKPIFTEDNKKQLEEKMDPFLHLDDLGRCNAMFVCIVGEKLDRSDNSIFKSRVKPTAWKSIGCDFIKDGKCLYNRCHLIGRQFGIKKVDKRGLITGTRKFNIEGMLKFEDKVANYIKHNLSHRILYRVTPYFEDKNLLAYGVQMEMLDIDDEDKFSYNVFVYNIQPGFIIDYRNGDVYSDYPLSLSGKKSGSDVYVIDMDTNRFHKKSCANVCKPKNKKYFVGEKRTIEKNYCKCENCFF